MQEVHNIFLSFKFQTKQLDLDISMFLFPFIHIFFALYYPVVKTSKRFIHYLCNFKTR